MPWRPAPPTSDVRILVTGATGYIGGRLVPRLAAAGHDVRCRRASAAKRGWWSFPLPGPCGAWSTAWSAASGSAGPARPDHTAVDEAIDFWRVEALERGRQLRLRAEMRLPGGAGLEFGIEPGDPPVLHQRALFIPRGHTGHLYWWSVWPFDGIVFQSMLRNLARAAAGRPTQPDLAPGSGGSGDPGQG